MAAVNRTEFKRSTYLSYTYDILLSFCGIRSRILRVTVVKLPDVDVNSARITVSRATRLYMSGMVHGAGSATIAHKHSAVSVGRKVMGTLGRTE